MARIHFNETGCYDINGNKVSSGRYFIPQKDACLHCKCSDGEPQACVLAKCAKPTCKDYKSIPGKCCAYTCPSETTTTAQLAVIISLSVGLLLLVILLMIVIYWNRKRKRNETRHHVHERNNVRRNGPLNNRLRTIHEESDGFDLPPPYTPGNVQTSRKIVTVVSTRPPNEPPPPYDIGREATEV